MEDIQDRLDSFRVVVLASVTHVVEGARVGDVTIRSSTINSDVHSNLATSKYVAQERDLRLYSEAVDVHSQSLAFTSCDLLRLLELIESE